MDYCHWITFHVIQIALNKQQIATYQLFLSHGLIRNCRDGKLVARWNGALHTRSDKVWLPWELVMVYTQVEGDKKKNPLLWKNDQYKHALSVVQKVKSQYHHCCYWEGLESSVVFHPHSFEGRPAFSQEKDEHFFHHHIDRYQGVRWIDPHSRWFLSTKWKHRVDLKDKSFHNHTCKTKDERLPVRYNKMKHLITRTQMKELSV